MIELQQAAHDLLAEIGMPNLLPPDAKVFFMHQGYEFAYFLPASNDPAVFQFYEGQGEVARPWDSMTAFFADAIGQHLSVRDSLN